MSPLVTKVVLLWFGVFSSSRVVMVQGQSPAPSKVESFNLGFLDMELKSTSSSETNLLLKTLLGVTVDFLHKSFETRAERVFPKNPMNSSNPGTIDGSRNSVTFQRVSCSIHSYQLGTSGDTASSSTSGGSVAVNITVTGLAYFLVTGNESISWWNVSEWTALAFENDVDTTGSTTGTDSSVSTHSGSFVQALTDSPDPFLSNITYAAVLVDGAVVAANNMNDGTRSGSGESSSFPFTVLEVWMIPLIGGGGAFLLVLCCIVTCICCMRVDEQNALHKSIDGGNPRTGGNVNAASNPSLHPPGVAGVVTVPTSMVNPDEDGDEENRTLPSQPPSPAKSIGSQDSSTFTYNPKSVRSFDNRTASSYYSYSRNGMEMDLNTWQHAGASTSTAILQSSLPQPTFGHDISVIEEQASKRDLSLIQEGEDESAAGSSPLDRSASSSRSRHCGSGKYKSLLSRCSGGDAMQLRLDNNTEKHQRRPLDSGCELSHGDTNQHQQRDDDRDDEDHSDDNSSFFGPSQMDDEATGTNTPYRMNLNGSSADILHDLHNLSSEIDHVRGSMSLTKTASLGSSEHKKYFNRGL